MSDLLWPLVNPYGFTLLVAAIITVSVIVSFVIDAVEGRRRR